jgi:hypothetical protein
MPRGPDGEIEHAVVKRRRLDDNGNPMGQSNNNPILDSRVYDIEFLDGTIKTVTANTIAENILSQVDAEGHRMLMLDEIIDHHVLPTAVSKDKGTFITSTGQT